MRFPLLVFAAWLLMLFSCVSVGWWVQQRFMKRTLSLENALEAFWIGWALSIVLLQLWHFALPISKLTVLVICLFGVVCCYQVRSDLGPLIRAAVIARRRLLLYAFLTIIGTFWLITRTMFSASVYDHALYYLQTEKWFSTYPIVLGLGNLHGRLAFNSTYLLFTSLFQTWFGLPRAFHVGNGLLIWVLLVQLAQGILAISKLGRRAALWQWFCMLCIVPVSQQLILNWRIGWSNDFPVFVLGIVMGVQALKLFEQNDQSPEIFYHICYLALLASIGITIKLSFAVWCIGLLGLTLIVYRHILFSRSNALKGFILLTVIMLSGLVPWVMRNVALSGYLIYPISATVTPVPWHIPIPSTIAEAQAIFGWARLPNAKNISEINNWGWLNIWLQRITTRTFEVILPIALALFAGLSLALLQRKFQFPLKRLWIIPLIAILSLFYWFFTAPDVRFAGSLFWLLVNGLFIIVLAMLPQKYRLLPTCAVVIVTAMFAFTDFGAFTERGATNAPMETPDLQQTTIGTYTLFFPLEGDRCGDAPIPCAPGIPSSRLRLRTPNNLANGFSISDTP